MTLEARFRAYLAAYARRDVAAIEALLAPQVRLRDWAVSVQGREAVLAATRHNFDTARSIEIEVLQVHVNEHAVAGELRIVVDGSIELFVVDVIDFDAQGQVLAIRAYKGRGD